MPEITAQHASNLFRNAPQKHIKVSHGQVAYRCIGEGPDVLFVHGWPVHSATFRKLLPMLTPHVTCHLIDLVGTGQSIFDEATELSIANHIKTVREVVARLALEDFAVVGHDSGGLISRHALAGDPRVRAWALINTELSQGLGWRFQQFIMSSKMPGFMKFFTWISAQHELRRNPFILGDCFHDRALIDGEFDAFFLQPIQNNEMLRWAAGVLLRSFDANDVHALGDLHAKIDVPVHLIWGEDDPFFPVEQAKQMVNTFQDAQITVIQDAKLFVHEEYPEQVAQAMLPTLLHKRDKTHHHAA